MKRKAESSEENFSERKLFNKDVKMDAFAELIKEHFEFTGNSYDLVKCSSINRYFNDIGIESTSSFINDVLREKFGYYNNDKTFCEKINLTIPQQLTTTNNDSGIGKNTPERIHNEFWKGMKHRTNQELNLFHYGARKKSYDPIKKYEQFNKDVTDDNNKSHQRQVLCVTPTRVTELNDYICEPLNNEMATYPPLSPKSQNSYNIIQSLEEFYDDFVELYYPESTQNQQFNCLLI